MRARSALPVVLILMVFIAQGVAALEYVESSAGLVPPSMEGGHTELEFADINADGVIDVADLQILASGAMTKADWYSQ